MRHEGGETDEGWNVTRTVCVLGDGLTAGIGDGRHLGWVGRVLARSRTADPVTTYTLAVAGETTTRLAARWKDETSRRWGRAEDRMLLVAPGHGDVDGGLSLARSRLNLANILDDARSAGIRAFVLGPTPTLRGDDAAITALSGAYAEVCDRRSLPFAELAGTLSANEEWLADLGTTDGVHPSQVGYGLIAWLLLHQGWHEWFGSVEA